ncbi:septation protein IspZ [Sneathiella marina]|uniref:Inner membrane-spanning protein YciB n=1 Tax=Sneathiella marina TaxID=2950108 RepID=A0ABY4W6G4_9PROT|nr:inner membrane-spanning protein YciB [Sneathiella marina]USG62758.1 septation protein IspZ [Sneathiella marina]
MTDKKAPHPKPQISPVIRLLIDVGPLLLFFVVDQMADIFVATAALLMACIASFAASWTMMRKIPVLPSVSLLFVLIFGSLTLLLGDEEFIKIEVSITNALCGAFLLTGLLFGQSFLKTAFGEVLEVDDEGWRKLTLRLGLFLIAIGILNEAVRHITSNDLWVAFRVYGILGLNCLFFFSQIPLIKRHMTEEEDAPAE